MDRRTRLGRALRQAGEELADHLGIEPSVTQQRQIESLLICDVLITAGTAAVERLGPIDKRRNVYRPIVKDLLAVIERRRVLCADLGWARQSRPALSLRAYLEAKAAESERSRQAEAQDPPGPASPPPAAAGEARNP